MAALFCVDSNCVRKFFAIYGRGDALLMLKRVVAFAARTLGTDPLSLYSLPVREIVQWCNIAHDMSRVNHG